MLSLSLLGDRLIGADDVQPAVTESGEVDRGLQGHLRRLGPIGAGNDRREHGGRC